MATGADDECSVREGQGTAKALVVRILASNEFLLFLPHASALGEEVDRAGTYAVVVVLVCPDGNGAGRDGNRITKPIIDGAVRGK